MDQLINYTLHLADDALILGHRNSEWTGHGPILEQDIAISNIALDQIGQARNFYQYAAVLINNSAIEQFNNITSQPPTEDTLAYFRNANDFKNCLLVEQSNGDWAKTILRQFFFSVYQYFLYQHLQNSIDETLAAIAEKSLKEVTYHLRWSSEWVIRLGDGSEESHSRMIKAIDNLWMFTEEMFQAASYEVIAVKKGFGVDVSSLKNEWMKKVKDIFDEATLSIPENVLMQKGGKKGKHTEHLENILTEMQFLQRTHPNSEW
ncbi:MAG TPA: 1,2-phenylacetyl-CoA epoxidase subunit PaaC [Puia sp.]|jgi:ring-1,2-phenylacetyl-CoA epoxidase subunit PaaC|nr:1,2-phenylacetyl-CoA epoxidase subunit PaaC [Puia sp.]